MEPADACQQEGARLIDDERVRQVVVGNLQFVARNLRRLGVPDAELDDAVQEVMIVMSQRLADVPVAKERSFLYGVIVRTASETRRGRRRFAQAQERLAREPLPHMSSPLEAKEEREDRALLAQALDCLPMDHRTVFVLYELEELNTREIAALLEIPLGTVKTRLRRAREQFIAEARRLTGGNP